MATSIVKDYGDGDYQVLTTLTASGGEVDDWLKGVQRIHRRRLNDLLVGLDVEWRPSFVRNVPPGPVAVLQICVGRRCLVFQIKHADYIPQSLFDFVSDDRFTFVGVGIHDDVDKLSEEYDLEVENAVDLGRLAAKKLGKQALRNAGLKAVVREVMGVQMEKPRRVQVSAWDARRLSLEQLQYACADAFASFEVGRRLYDGDY